MRIGNSTNENSAIISLRKPLYLDFAEWFLTLFLRPFFLYVRIDSSK